MRSMASVFEALDFEKFDHPLSSMPAYRWQFGPQRSSDGPGEPSVFMLTGIVNTGRTLGMIESQLPLEVASHEEGLALLSYCLGQHIPEENKLPWLQIGEKMKAHLP